MPAITPALHTFTITSSTYKPSSDGSDVYMTITGTVDGQPVTAYVWKSAYDQAASKSAATLQAFVAQSMYQAFLQAFPPAPASPVTQVASTFTFSL